MPTARAFAAAVEFEGQIYVVGGLDAAGDALEVVEVYDPRTDAWSTCPPLDIGRSRLAAVNHMGASILVAGGLTAGGENANQQRVLVRLPGKPLHWGYWPGPLAPTRHGLGLVDADDGTERVFAVGGNDGAGPLADVQWWGIGTVNVRDAEGNLRWPGAKSTDLDTGDVTTFDEDYQGYGWWPGPPLATARGFLGVARIGRRIYAVGGRLREIPATEVLDLDALEDGWRKASPLPKDLCRFSLVEWGGHLLAFGGETEFGATINTDVLEYDPAADTWTVR
jgi:kelch-like protein 18